MSVIGARHQHVFDYDVTGSLQNVFDRLEEMKSSKSDSVVERFSALYLGDSILERIDIQSTRSACILHFHSGALLGPDRDIFKPLKRCQPAIVAIQRVHSISFEPGYFLNSTVVDFCVQPLHSEIYAFSFELTGGDSNETFLVGLTIAGEDFRALDRNLV